MEQNKILTAEEQYDYTDFRRGAENDQMELKSNKNSSDELSMLTLKVQGGQE